MTDQVVLSWSGGKDAAFSLYTLQESGVEVVSLFTTVNEETDRSSMHGVRRDLYERQAAAIGLPIHVVDLPPKPSNEEYEAIMNRETERLAAHGIDAIAFGDLFLEDVRSYREDHLAVTSLEGRWPIWGRDTGAFMTEFLDAGFRAIITAVDGSALEPAFAGRELDGDLLASMPESVDPAGENGEFHTFVVDGPIFSEPVEVDRGRAVSKSVGETTMHYRDLLSVSPQDRPDVPPR